MRRDRKQREKEREENLLREIIKRNVREEIIDENEDVTFLGDKKVLEGDNYFLKSSLRRSKRLKKLRRVSFARMKCRKRKRVADVSEDQNPFLDFKVFLKKPEIKEEEQLDIKEELINIKEEIKEELVIKKEDVALLTIKEEVKETVFANSLVKVNNSWFVSDASEKLKPDETEPKKDHDLSMDDLDEIVFELFKDSVLAKEDKVNQENLPLEELSDWALDKLFSKEEKLRFLQKKFVESVEQDGSLARNLRNSIKCTDDKSWESFFNKLNNNSRIMNPTSNLKIIRERISYMSKRMDQLKKQEDHVESSFNSYEEIASLGSPFISFADFMNSNKVTYKKLYTLSNPWKCCGSPFGIFTFGPERFVTCRDCIILYVETIYPKIQTENHICSEVKMLDSESFKKEKEEIEDENQIRARNLF